MPLRISQTIAWTHLLISMADLAGSGRISGFGESTVCNMGSANGLRGRESENQVSSEDKSVGNAGRYANDRRALTRGAARFKCFHR